MTRAVKCWLFCALRYALFDGNTLDYDPGVTNVNQVAGPAGLSPSYHLYAYSNAIDRAVPVAQVTDDVDGDRRPLGRAPDVGADEARMVLLPLVVRGQ